MTYERLRQFKRILFTPIRDNRHDWWLFYYFGLPVSVISAIVLGIRFMDMHQAVLSGMELVIFCAALVWSRYTLFRMHLFYGTLFAMFVAVCILDVPFAYFVPPYALMLLSSPIVRWLRKRRRLNFRDNL